MAKQRKAAEKSKSGRSRRTKRDSPEKATVDPASPLPDPDPATTGQSTANDSNTNRLRDYSALDLAMALVEKAGEQANKMVSDLLGKVIR